MGGEEKSLRTETHTKDFIKTTNLAGKASTYGRMGQNMKEIFLVG